MSDLKLYELGIAILGESLVLAALIGLLVRKHVSACWAFALYLGAVFVSDTLMFLGGVPSQGSRFLEMFDKLDSMSFWVLKEILLTALKFAVAFELIGRGFSSFPGAHATARRAFWMVLAFTLVSTVWVAASLQDVGFSKLFAGLFGNGELDREAATRITDTFQPRILTATTWLFVTIAGLILWYRLPVQSMSKAILIGFVPYLLFSFLVLELRTANRWPREGWMYSLDTWAWILLLGYWARSAWQPFREVILPGRQRATAMTVQPG